MQGQKSNAVFNPTLVSLALKLAQSEDPKAQKVAEKISHFLFDSFPTSSPQIVCSELSKVVEMGQERKKRQRLEYL